MRGLLKLALAAAVLVGGPAQAQDQAAGWRRVQLPDGSAAAKFPCAGADLEPRSAEGKSVVLCAVDGLGYAMMGGGFPLKGGWSNDFDAVLADAEADKTAGTVTRQPIGMLRAFTVQAPANDALGLARVVELSPGHLVVLMAHEEPAGAITLDKAAAALARARAFLATLEVSEP